MQPTLKEIQKTQLKILEELDRVCKEYNVEYFLSFGTLIGAVRHGGFIPWDDDIDVVIDNKEVQKLMKVFNKVADEKYLLTNSHVEEHYTVIWSKIRNIHTLSMPVNYKDIPINWGICMDLFPFFSTSNNKFLRNCQVKIMKLANRINMLEIVNYTDGNKLYKRILAKTPLKIRMAVIDMLLCVFKLSKDDSEYICFATEDARIARREWFYGEKKSLSFEGKMYNVPSDYDSFLKSVYGDYMTPPPPEKRCGHELSLGDILWNCESEDLP